MDLETLFTEQKWQILYHLSLGENSPLQLAQKTNTTISNISQQLKLLEAAKLVAKKKIPNRDKGKPRSMFSLSNDYAYLISVTKDFTSKKLLNLTDYHKTILKIWSIKNADLHHIIADMYKTLLPNISEFHYIYLAEKDAKVTLNLVYNGSRIAQTTADRIVKKASGISNLQVDSIRAEKFASLHADGLTGSTIILHDGSNAYMPYSKDAGMTHSQSRQGGIIQTKRYREVDRR